MIVIFQSPASGDVIMFGDVARRMLEIMGKDAGNKGIITAEQLPDAIARLRAAVAAEKNTRDDESVANDATNDRRDKVTLAQRATPLLELLELSLRKNKPVVWGV